MFQKMEVSLKREQDYLTAKLNPAEGGFNIK